MVVPKKVRDSSYYNRHREIILARRKNEYHARTALTIARARKLLGIPLSVKLPYCFAKGLLLEAGKLDQTQDEAPTNSAQIDDLPVAVSNPKPV